MISSVKFVFFLAVFSDVQPLYIEELKNITFYCSKVDTNSVAFSLIQNNSQINLYDCKIGNACYSPVGGSAVLNDTGYYFPFSSEDINLWRSIIGFKCVFKSAANNVFENVAVVAKAQGVNCHDPQLTNNNTYISITCITTKIYPPASCTFDVSGQVSYSHVKYSEFVEYYQSNCTWTSAIKNFHAGNHTLLVSIYPNVTNNTSFGTKIRTYFQFTLPKLFLSTECSHDPNIVDGYIRPGASVVCVCYLENGYPPAILKWSNRSHLDLGQLLNNTATMLTTDPLSNQVTYYCTASTDLLAGNVTVLYEVNYAKGPMACSLEIQNTKQTIWHVCKNTFLNLTIICQVNKTDAVPGIKAKISINSIFSDVLESQNLTNFYEVKYTTSIIQEGNYSIGCETQNTLFTNVIANCSYLPALQVMAPPMTSPLLNIIYDANGIQENKVYNAVCTALGGTPPVSNITISCGNIFGLTHPGNKFTSPVTFTRNMTGQNCTCTAQHITGCYENNTSSFQLNISYESTITFFNDSKIIIENGTYAHLVCEADGNPAPNISIFKGNAIIERKNSGHILFYNKSMSCKDAGNYLCHTNNGINVSKNETKKVTLYIYCPLQFTNDEKMRNFSLQKGKIFTYNFSIYGYPEPDRFTIFKSKNKEIKNILVTNSSTEPPYTTVKILILNLTTADFDSYTLNIFQNGIHNLTLKFVIDEVDEPVIQTKEEKRFLDAALGGGIPAGCFVMILVIFLTYIYRRGNPLKLEKVNQYTTLINLTLDTCNGDIYSIKTEIKEFPKEFKEIGSETYKNYKDIVPTITTATAVPKNMYKPEVKPKPKVSKSTVYYNCVEPLFLLGHDLSAKKDLLDANIYANQGLNAN